MDYFNQKQVHLMVWEENPAKRNINNIVKFNLDKNITLSIGDRVLIGSEKQPVGSYGIDDIIEVRPSTLSAFNYCTVKTTYTRLS